MIETIKIYLSSVLVLAGLDGVWLGYVMKNFNTKHLAGIIAEQITWWPIIIFYPIYALGVYFFVINPSLEANSVYVALWRGGLLGLVSYAAYDLTNNATLANWPVVVTITDISWGALVTALTSVIVYFIFR